MNQTASVTTAFQSFEFIPDNNQGNLTDSIICTIQNDTITGYFPLNTTTTKLVAKFGVQQGITATVNGTIQIDGETANDFSAPVTYTLSANDSSSQTYVVILKKFTGLPIVYINTNNQIIYSKEVGINGTFSIDSNDVRFNSYSGTASFYIHGNSTATYPKLPYKVTLSSKSPLLGMPTSKKWILLANYDDKTLLRNYAALKISEMFGLFYTPRSQFVELVLNGSYAGDYQLIEQIDIDKNRLDIKDMDDDDLSGKSLTGGYLIEADNKGEDDDHMRFTTTLENNSFVIHDPSDSIAQQTEYISDYINHSEAALYTTNFMDVNNGYRQYLDPESFIGYFWVNELTRNNDAGFWTSAYLYKERDSLLNMGPVWDFDIAMGNTTYNDNQEPQGWWIRNQAWFNRLFQDSAFTHRAITKWQSVRSSLDSLNTIINNMAMYLHQSEIENFKRWNIINESFAPLGSPQIPGSYEGEITYMENWLTQRISWIDANLQALQLPQD
ncbi:MAG TPA: CotH kinase family protein [Arachidicoccus sp.]